MEKTNLSTTSSASQKLHREFVQLGRERNRLTYKLLNLLPEIYEKEIYKEHGCKTIEEYAGKYGGLSKFVVKKRLRMEKYLKDKPNLKAAIKDVGLHKVALVASLATAKTEADFAYKIRNMSKEAVQELSKEIRNKEAIKEKIPVPCRAADGSIKIELSGETMFLFLKLRKKFAPDAPNADALKIILEKLDIENDGQKVVPGDKKEQNIASNKPSGRYIPAGRRREILAQTDGKCAYPNCCKPYKILHHVIRYFDNKNHDYVVPLCKVHHEYMHNGIVGNEQAESEKWHFLLNNKPESKADLLYRKYRQEALL